MVRIRKEDMRMAVKIYLEEFGSVTKMPSDTGEQRIERMIEGEEACRRAEKRIAEVLGIKII